MVINTFFKTANRLHQTVSLLAITISCNYEQNINKERYLFSGSFLFYRASFLIWHTATTMNCFPHHVGSAASVYSSLQVIGAVVLTAVASINHHYDMQLMAWLFTGGAVLILIGYCVTKTNKHKIHHRMTLSKRAIKS